MKSGRCPPSLRLPATTSFPPSILSSSMPVSGHQGNHRKTLAVKHQDGEPLTRSDLQYDLLYYLFNDKRTVFTDPHRTIHGEPPGSKVAFRDLYVNALVHSPRCSKVSRDKLLDTPHFADEFAKISLLSNIGRINTTMAFFPEMRTALRTYHPVPSLQKTDGNLQDAPRIKNILKSCLLSTEIQNTPATPAEVLNRSRSGVVPPTSIVNLVFIFASHATVLAQNHFPSPTSYDILDFFSPIPISSETRARAFLWLCYHYYEAPSQNPFDDDYSRRHPGTIPTLESLSTEEALLENLDTPAEKEWGEKMTVQRRLFIESKDKIPLLGEHSNDSQEPEGSAPAPKQRASRSSRGIGQGRGRGRGRGRGGRQQKARDVSMTGISDSKPSRQTSLSPGDDTSFQSATPDYVIGQHTSEGPSGDSRRLESYSHPQSLSPDPNVNHQFPNFPSPPPLLPTSDQASHHDRRYHSRQPLSASIELNPRRRHAGEPLHVEASDGKPIRNKRRGSARPNLLSRSSLPTLHQHRLDSYVQCSSPRDHPSLSAHLSPLLQPTESHSRSGYFSQHRRVSSVLSLNTPSTFSFPRPRTMLEQAWHVATTTDPLENSDDEADENTRLDLLLRLKIINRLRGKEPTPDPDPAPAPVPALIPAPVSTPPANHRRVKNSRR